MTLALEILLFIVSIVLVLLVLLQPSKSAGFSGMMGGGAEQMFGKAKSRGIDVILSRVTVTVAVLFMILVISIAFLVR